MSFFDILSTILPLVLITGLLYLLLRLIRKTGFKFKPYGPSSMVNIKVISTQMIMPRKFLTLVNVNGTVLLLGVSENSISMLKEFEGIEFPGNTEEVQGTKFLDYLKSNLGLKNEA